MHYILTYSLNTIYYANLFEQTLWKKAWAWHWENLSLDCWAEHFENCSYRQSVIRNLNLSDQMTRLEIFTIHIRAYFILYLHLVATRTRVHQEPWNYLYIFGGHSIVSLVQGIYENWVKNDRNVFEIPALLSCTNEEIQSGKIQNNISILNFPALFSAEFHHLQDNRAGISKNFLSFFTLIFYTIPCKSIKSLGLALRA